MKRQTDFIIALLALCAIILLYNSSPEKPPHKCNFMDCPMTGQTQFESDAEEDTDSYYYDLTHWNHPQWSWEEVVDYTHSTN